MIYTEDERATAQRAKRKAAKREENKRIWAERHKKLEPLKPVGVSTKDDKRRIQELRNELLTAENGLMVVRKIIHKALDDEDKDQAAMLKLCADRIIPVSMFEDKKDGSRTAIQITISGINDAITIDGESKEVDGS